MTSLEGKPIVDGEITALIQRCSAGQKDVRARLVELMYPELRRIAEARMRMERPDHTLQPTALVNEFFLELAASTEMSWRTRAHFLAVASRAMHRYLIDYARARNALKRQGGRVKLQLDAVGFSRPEEAFDALDVDEVLDELKAEDSRVAQVVEMRCFGGLTHAEIAQALGFDERTIKRDWQFGRAWMLAILRRK